MSANPLFRSARGACQWLPEALLAIATALAGAIAAGLLLPAAALAENSIDNVAVSRGTAGRTVIRMVMKEPLATGPAGFSINNPPRIALDFPATANNTGRAVQDV